MAEKIDGLQYITSYSDLIEAFGDSTSPTIPPWRQRDGETSWNGWRPLFQTFALVARVPLADYAAQIAPRLRALYRAEPPPKVMGDVLKAWGLPLPDKT